MQFQHWQKKQFNLQGPCAGSQIRQLTKIQQNGAFTRVSPVSIYILHRLRPSEFTLQRTLERGGSSLGNTRTIC